MENPVIIIPARVESKRLPRKVLLDINGMTLLERVYQNARQVTDRVYVATGDDEIIDVCVGTSMSYVHTKKDHPNGTNRCAEAAKKVMGSGDHAMVINLQADEVDLRPEELKILMYEASSETISTLVFPLELDRSENTTRAVVTPDERGIWFSRSDMKCARHGHVGVYAFPNLGFLEAASRPPTEISRLEGLEQLTWIEEEWEITVVEIDRAPISINTEEDLERYRESIGC